MKANLPPNEEARLKALHEYQILDTLPQQAYDDITHLAAQICGAPIALVSLVDSDRQWFKAKIGVEAEELPRDIAFCAHAILEPNEIFIVPDAHQDERFANNPLVLANPNIRFYAGAPLVTPEGDALGSLCVIDREPRQLSAEQLDALRALSRQVMAQMQLQKYFDELSQTLQERRQMEKELRASEQRFQTFMDNSPALAFVKDEAGVYTYVNRPFLKRFQLQENQVIGKNDLELWPAESAKEFQEHDLSALKSDEMVTSNESVTEANGQVSHWLSFKFPLQNQDKRFLAGMAIDITQRKLYEQQLEEYKNKLETLVAQLEIQSRSDGLTGLLNRRAFDEKLDEEFARARRYDLPLSLVMLDVDKFKVFNDSFGHIAGDEILQTVANALQAEARTTDSVARYGGEEFIIILPNTNTEGALIFAERFRHVIEAVAWPHRAITISIGVASFDDRFTQSEALVEAADQALYQAKANGRNRVECATID